MQFIEEISLDIASGVFLPSSQNIYIFLIIIYL